MTGIKLEMQNQIPENWQKVTLGELASFYYGKMPERERLNRGGPFVVYSGYQNVGYYDDYNSDEDLIVVARGVGGTGDIKISPAKSFVTNLSIVIKLKQGVIDKNYLYYKYKLRGLKYLDSGSAQSQITIADLEKLEIDLPPFTVQQKNVAILSIYDDKIELNNKIAKNLEQTAQVVFKEWFVNFRFPGYEKVRMVDSKLGKIPYGWSLAPMVKFASVVLGGTPSRLNPAYWNGDIPWINSGEVNKFRVIAATEYITKEGLSNSSARIMPRRSTLMAITGATLGQVSLSEIEVSANQSVVGVFDMKEKLNNYFYLYILSNIKEIINNAGGGAQQHINKEIVENFPILIPVNGLIKDFNLIINPVLDRITSAVLENERLIKMRDLLLPKLMKGEIRV